MKLLTKKIRLQKLEEIFQKGKFNSNGCLEWQNTKDKCGYGVTNFKRFFKKKIWKVHRLVYFLLFADVEGYLVCHHCDNPLCFHPDHLFLGTPKDNSRDRERKKRGRTQNQNGEKNHSAILTEKDVTEIRAMANNGLRQCKISSILNINPTIIGKIVRRERWKHI